MDALNQFGRTIYRSPFVWGGLATFGFYIAVRAAEGSLNPWLLRCLTGRWEAYVCVALFFVGLVSMAKHGVSLALQYTHVSRQNRPPQIGTEAMDNVQADLKTEITGGTPLAAAGTYLARRQAAAHQAVNNGCVGERLASYLRELADADTVNMDRRYELVRFVLRSLPAVGCLATVFGIAHAISQASVTDAETMVTGMTAGLAQAFDTFALAIVLSQVLVVQKFAASQFEQRLLKQVDLCIERELQQPLNTAEPSVQQAEVLRHLASTVVRATEQMSREQSTLAERLRTSGSGTSAPPMAAASAGLDERRLESVVANAVSAAIQQRGGDSMGSPMDMSGWKPLQQAMQQVASYLARQQARQEDEGKVVQQLMHIIEDETGGEVFTPDRPATRRRVA